MAKGPIVTPDVEMLITDIHKQHPRWKAPMVRNEVESILRSSKRGLPEGWPSLSKVQKVLAVIRKNEEEGSEEDELWHIGTLKKYPIPPDALPHVIRFWLNSCRHGQKVTIRDAQWAARLYACMKGLDYEVVDFYVGNFVWNELAMEKLGICPDFMPPFDYTLNMLLALEVMEIDEQTIANVKKLYEKSNRLRRDYNAPKELEWWE